MAGDQQFVNGEVVKLRSGGPAMTVLWTNSEGKIGCKWWNPASAKFETEAFLSSSLRESSPTV